MNKTIFKRLLAYIIDTIIVSMFVLILSFIPLIGKSASKYTDISTEIAEVEGSYSNNEISLEEYNAKMIDLTYKLNKEGIIYIFVNFISLCIYFIVFQYFNKGQTIGKKILNIKVVSNSNEKLTIFSCVVRSLIINNLFSISICFLCTLFLNKNIYYTVSNGITNIGAILLYASIIYAFFNKEGRTLHDILSKSKVIDLKEKEIEKESNDKIIEAVYEEN